MRTLLDQQPATSAGGGTGSGSVGGGDHWSRLKEASRERQSVVEGLLRELQTLAREEQAVEEVEREIGEQLEELGRLVQQLSGCTEGSAARSAQVHRLRDLQEVWRAEMARVKAGVEQRRLRTQMLGRRRSGEGVVEGGRATLLKERTQLLGAVGEAEQSVRVGEETQRMLREQSRRVAGMREKLGVVAGRIPGVQGLMKKIRDKQFREELVLAVVIASGLFWVFWKLLLGR